jgi:two-component system chemotaxis response regulator CheY
MARILVMDDEAARLTLQEILEEAGHTVAFAANGEQGIAYYEQHPFDVVIVELVMPVKNGLQTIRELHSEYNDAKIIAVTAQDRENLPLAEEYGALGSLTKPFESERLLEMVEWALGQTGAWDTVYE